MPGTGLRATAEPCGRSRVTEGLEILIVLSLLDSETHYYRDHDNRTRTHS